MPDSDFKKSVMDISADIISSSEKYHEATKEDSKKLPVDLYTSVFERNFAEFPLFNLSKNDNRKEMTYSDFIRGRDSKKVERIWEIDGHKTHGLGSPSTFEVLFMILQVWREQNFTDSKIHIGSYYSLLKRLGWGRSKASYERLKKDIAVLTSINIDCKNAFYDTNLKAYVNKKYSLFEGHTFYLKSENDKETRPDDWGYIRATHDFHESIVQNTQFFFPVDQETFFTFTPMERKLSLYLTKMFVEGNQLVHQRNIEHLAKQIPIKYSNIKVLKRQFKIITDGLIKKGFPYLKKAEYSKSRDTILIKFYRVKTLQLGLFDEKPASVNDDKVTQQIYMTLSDYLNNPDFDNYYKKISKKVPDYIFYKVLNLTKEGVYDIEATGSTCDKGKIFNKVLKEYATDFLKDI